MPLAAVLWNGGISFGGVIAFLFADLIVLPILDIYRRYYGLRIALLLLAVSYAAMAGAAYILELVFDVAGLVPQQRSAQIIEAHLIWNYTTWLNIVFLGLSALLVWRFLKTGGPQMLRIMNQPAPAEAPNIPEGERRLRCRGNRNDESCRPAGAARQQRDPLVAADRLDVA